MTSTGSIADFYVNGIIITQLYNFSNNTLTASFIVPYGATYKVVADTGTISITKWFELI